MVTLKIRKAAPVLAILFCAIFLLQLPVTVLSVQACETVQPVPGTKLDVEADVGSMHFRGEIADFYVLFSLVGNPVDPCSIDAKLYFNGTLCAQLTSSVRRVATGLYRIPYTIPLNASAGTYALVVDASYPSVDGKTFDGTALKSFLLSQNSNWMERLAHRDSEQHGYNKN